MTLRTKLVVTVLSAAAVTLLLLTWRGFWLQHALLIGVAIGALVYSAFGTAERLKRSWTRKGPRSIRPREERQDPPA